jgi:DNA polymerase III delta prime subunit
LREISRKILSGAVASGRIPNAYLFAGNALGVLLEETLFLASLLTSEADAAKIRKGLHPDFLLLQRKTVKIDDIRELTEYARTGPVSASWKIIVVEAADTMTPEAANSFLKTLEEPAPNVLIILTTVRPSKMLGTILSRCQKLEFYGEEAVNDEASQGVASQILGLDRMDIPQILSFSESISEMENIGEVLNGALYEIRAKIDATSVKWFRALKEMFHAVSSLERHGNKRLTLDNMLFSMKEAISN